MKVERLGRDKKKISVYPEEVKAEKKTSATKNATTKTTAKKGCSYKIS